MILVNTIGRYRRWGGELLYKLNGNQEMKALVNLSWCSLPNHKAGFVPDQRHACSWRTRAKISRTAFDVVLKTCREEFRASAGIWICRNHALTHKESLVYITRKDRYMHLGLEARKWGKGRNQAYEDLRLINCFTNIYLLGFIYLFIRYIIYACGGQKSACRSWFSFYQLSLGHTTLAARLGNKRLSHWVISTAPNRYTFK